MRRCAAIVLGLALLAACGAKRSSGPAWPKSAGRMEVEPEKDGGETLEPQQSVSVAAVEHAEDRTPAVDAEAIVVDEPSPAKGDEKKPETTPETTPETKADVKAPTGTIEVIEVKPQDIDSDR